MLNAGQDQTLNVTFTPADPTEYTTATYQVSINVLPAAPTVLVSPGGTYDGAPVPAYAIALGIDGATPVAGSFSFSYGDLTSVLASAPVNAGDYNVVATFASDDPNYSSETTDPSYFPVYSATLTITPSPNQSMTLGASVPALTYSATGFVDGDSTSILTGSLGTLATSSSPAGEYAFTLGSLSAGSNYSLQLDASTFFTITPTPLTISTTSLANWTVDQSGYSETITATGGAGSDAFAVTGGSLPTGLSLSGSGALTGTPTVAGSYSFTVTATDSLGDTATETYTNVTINPAPTISTEPASVAIYYGQSDPLSVTAANGTGPYTYQWYIGASGQTANPITGAVGNTYAATPASTTSYWVQVTDSLGVSVSSATATVTVDSLSGAIFPTTSSVTATGYFPGGPPQDAFDDSAATYWSAGGYAGTITAQFTTPITLSGVVLLVNSQPTTSEDYTVSASTDGITFTTLAQSTQDVVAGSVETLVPITFPIGTYQYLQIAVNGGLSWVGVNEVQLLVPAGSALNSPAATEGEPFSNATVFHFIDANPAAVAGDFTATVNTGDATLTNTANPHNVQVVADPGGGFDVQLSYTYAEALSNQTFSVSVSDAGGDSLSASNSSFSVADAPLTGSSAAKATGGVEGVTPANLSNATFTDAAGSYGSAGDFTVTAADWGDGSTSTAGLTISGSEGSYTVAGSHMYTEAGIYDFTFTVQDDGGSTATITGTATVFSAANDTFIVTNTSNSALVSGSLPWAVAAADNDTSGAAITITFAAGSSQTFATPQTITLAQSLTLSNTTAGESITIQGPAAALTIQGGGSGSNFSVITVAANTTVTIENATITDGNTSDIGGGIFNSGTLSLSDCTIAGDTASFGGGGIGNNGVAALAVNDCTFSDNSAEYGSGIYNWGLFDGSSTVTVSNSTFGGNSAGDLGGGIYNEFASVYLSNCTFTGNQAIVGGGIDNDAATLSASDCTFSGNSANAGLGGAIAVSRGGGATLFDTIVANCPSGGDLYIDSSGGTFSGSSDLVDDATGGTSGDGYFGASSFYDVAAGLDPNGLRNNGGPTQTIALLPGSPAIGAGATVSGIITDQRGVVRPASSPDIGAFQSVDFVVNNTSNSSTTTGSLPWAVSQADSDTSAGPVYITFAARSGQIFATSQTITLTGTLNLSNTTAGESTTIDGPAAALTIAGGGASSNFSVITVAAGVTADLESLTISDGLIVGGGRGGGITNAGTLTVLNSTLSDNTATYGTGGAIFNSGTLWVLNSTVSNNSGWYAGGGIDNQSMLTVANSTFADNASTDCTSSALSQTVNQASVKIALTSSANPATTGESVTFTDTLTAVSPGSGVPTGTVTFMDGTTVLGTATLSGGVATLTATDLPEGKDKITAVYSGDSDFLGLTSSVLTETVS